MNTFFACGELNFNNIFSIQLLCCSFTLYVDVEQTIVSRREIQIYREFISEWDGDGVDSWLECTTNSSSILSVFCSHSKARFNTVQTFQMSTDLNISFDLDKHIKKVIIRRFVNLPCNQRPESNLCCYSLSRRMEKIWLMLLFWYPTK